MLIEAEQELKETKRRESEIIEELTSLGLNYKTPGLEMQLESQLHRINLEIQELKDRLDELTKEDG